MRPLLEAGRKRLPSPITLFTTRAARRRLYRALISQKGGVHQRAWHRGCPSTDVAPGNCVQRDVNGSEGSPLRLRQRVEFLLPGGLKRHLGNRLRRLFPSSEHYSTAVIRRRRAASRRKLRRVGLVTSFRAARNARGAEDVTACMHALRERPLHMCRQASLQGRGKASCRLPAGALWSEQ